MHHWLIKHDTTPHPLTTQLAQEQAMLDKVRQDGQPRVWLWRSKPALVVTRSESRLPRFAEAAEQLAAEGWPISVRRSGGTAVPQSPDTLNLTMVYKGIEQQSDKIAASYRLLCTPITAALRKMGLSTQTTSVAGAFCDGHYNLAITRTNGTIQKIVGTSQTWTADGITLAHAVILVTLDTDDATKRINRFYEYAGSEERKNSAAVTSIANRLQASTNAAKTHIQVTLINKLLSACQQLPLI